MISAKLTSQDSQKIKGVVDHKWSELKIQGKNINRRCYHTAVFHAD